MALRATPTSSITGAWRSTPWSYTPNSEIRLIIGWLNGLMPAVDID